MQDGESIQLGKSAFVVVEKSEEPKTPETVTLEDELREIRLPQVNFRNASTEDCVRFIQEQVSALRPGVELHILVKRAKSFRAIDTERMDPFAEPSSPAEDLGQARVTHSEVNGSVLEVLNEVAQQSGFQIRYSGRRITLIQ